MAAALMLGCTSSEGSGSGNAAAGSGNAAAGSGNAAAGSGSGAAGASSVEVPGCADAFLELEYPYIAQQLLVDEFGVNFVAEVDRMSFGDPGAEFVDAYAFADFDGNLTQYSSANVQLTVHASDAEYLYVSALYGGNQRLTRATGDMLVLEANRLTPLVLDGEDVYMGVGTLSDLGQELYRMDRNGENRVLLHTFEGYLDHSRLVRDGDFLYWLETTEPDALEREVVARRLELSTNTVSTFGSVSSGGTYFFNNSSMQIVDGELYIVGNPDGPPHVYHMLEGGTPVDLGSAEATFSLFLPNDALVVSAFTETQSIERVSLDWTSRETIVADALRGQAFYWVDAFTATDTEVWWSVGPCIYRAPR